MLRTVRKADIPIRERDVFERYGENVIGSILATGLRPTIGDLYKIYEGEAGIKEHARDWLTERADAHERREQRLEILEWTIVVLIVLELIPSIVQLFK